jgi:peptide/nickel transport system ATP-binding protein
MAEPLLRVEALSKHFDVSRPWLNRVLEGGGRDVLKAVDRVSFAIPRGATVSLVGESGCGKSTVARTIVGLHRPTEGRVLFDGADLARLRSRRQLLPFRRRMQMIFQDPYASLNPRWRVGDIVAEPIRAHRLRPPGAPVRHRVAELLSQVGIAPDDGARFPHEFSGGQRQRISIARALASEPDFLICDEPTSALDVSVQAQILNLMTDLQRRLGLTVLFISHDLSVVDHVSDFVGVMYLGRLVEWAEARTLFRWPRHPYSRLLLDTIPRLARREVARAPLAGEVPNPLSPPPGCPFHPRCPHAEERCRTERPLPVRTAEGSEAACHAVAEGRLKSERWAPSGQAA